jgi:pantoate--beta-alanine ligase
MRIVHHVGELHAALAGLRGARRRLALVPTMGNLHEGHLALVRRARELADRVVVSIFVNPLQFGPGEDYARYPRTLDADAHLLAEQGVALLWAPGVEDIYPEGYPPATTIHVAGPLTDQLEGAFRPGHFAGVATVVNILFNRVRPDLAVFGEKDWQQLAVIRRMVADLGLCVDLVGVPTCRAADGLALSSRNQYLSAEERARAPVLYAALQDVAAGLRAGRRDFEVLCAQASARLQAQGFRPQYLEVRALDLSPADVHARQFVILAAAYLGTTRLIDNLPVRLD